jgi:hypothetical protein
MMKQKQTEHVSQISRKRESWRGTLRPSDRSGTFYDTTRTSRSSARAAAAAAAVLAERNGPSTPFRTPPDASSCGVHGSSFGFLSDITRFPWREERSEHALSNIPRRVVVRRHAASFGFLRDDARHTVLVAQSERALDDDGRAPRA